MDGAWKKYFALLRTGSYVKNRWGSCGDSHFGWGSHIWKVMGRDVEKGMLEKVPAYNDILDVFFRDPKVCIWRGFIHGII